MTHRATGARLGPYELVSVLGAGGSGEVWEAVLHGPGGFRKPVALKLLHGPTDPAQREALLREARLGARLQHPNVVGTLHVGDHDGTTCVALELVRGMSIDALRRHAGGRLPPGAVVDTGVQVAAALHHVHGLGAPSGPALVHRDVKPANLLVDHGGLVKLADLGIAVLDRERGQGAGTPGYTAPEQLDGNAEPRSDLFSLGAVLYLLATGVRPFGSGDEALAAVRRVEALLASPRFLARVEEAVPDLAPVVRACLRADPGDRPASARELGSRLAALRARQPRGPTLADLVARAEPPPSDVAVRSAPPGNVPPARDAPVSDLPTRHFPTGNLPSARDTFVGREPEIAELSTLVSTERWIVLLGPGGTGKTRLALEVARRARTGLPGGAWVVDLTEARDAEGVCAASARAFGIDLERRDPVGQVGRALAGKGRALFVLDNLEQCVGALAETVGRWLACAGEATFIGTTRIAPALAGERLVALGELAPGDAATLLRQRAPRPLAEREEAEVGALVGALEHMPLAIELAAARLRILDLPTVRARLSLQLLAGGGRDRPERHRSVTASLRWSWELLSSSGSRALAQLSVFEGGFDLSAAEAVIGPGSPWAIDVVQELVDASLLGSDPATGRFSLRVVVREFAAASLAPEEQVAAEARHGAFYAQLGSPEVAQAIHGPAGRAWSAVLVRELDNLVAACARALARGDGPVATATAAAADVVLRRRGPVARRAELAVAVADAPGLSPADRARAAFRAGSALVEVGRGDDGVRRIEQALAPPVDRACEAAGLTALGKAHLDTGRPEDARTALETALGLHRAAGDRPAEVATRNFLGALCFRQGRMAEASEHYERALAQAREDGLRELEADGLANVAMVRIGQGRPADALALLEAALPICGEGSRAEGIVQLHLGDAHFRLGDLERARVHYERALAVRRDVGVRREEAAAWWCLGRLHATQREHEEARGCFERALALHRDAGYRRGEGLALTSLADVLRDDGRADEALALYERALAVHRDVGNRGWEGVVLREVGTLHARQGRNALARACYEQALPLNRAFSSPNAESQTCVALARLVARTEGPAAGLPWAERAVALVEGSPIPSDRAWAHTVHAELSLGVGDAAAARRHLAEAERIGVSDARVADEVARVRALLPS